MNSLWLIGLWERSRASKTIKQLCGNQDAVASAYSLFDYHIADDLGGEDGLHQSARPRVPQGHSPGQRHGAQPHGHRFALGDRASRVVHLALANRPIRRTASTGPICPRDGRVEIKIEDHYYDADRRGSGLPAPRQVDRRDALHLSRQRRHQLSLERHRAARLSESRGARAGDPDHPARGAAVSDHPLRRRDDAGQAALPAAVVSRARARAAPFPRAPSTA